MSKRSVFCITHSRGRADHIVNDLKGGDFLSTDVSVLFLDRVSGDESPAGKRTSAASAESAGAVRGVLAWITGIGPVKSPGSEPLIGAGRIATAVSGARAVGIAGGLIDFGVPQAEAQRYEARIKEGHLLLAVHTENPDKGDRAREVFTAAGAEDIFTIMEVTTPRISLLSGRVLPRPTVV